MLISLNFAALGAQAKLGQVGGGQGQPGQISNTFNLVNPDAFISPGGVSVGGG